MCFRCIQIRDAQNLTHIGINYLNCICAIFLCMNWPISHVVILNVNYCHYKTCFKLWLCCYFLLWNVCSNAKCLHAIYFYLTLCDSVFQIQDWMISDSFEAFFQFSYEIFLCLNFLLLIINTTWIVLFQAELRASIFLALEAQDQVKVWLPNRSSIEPSQLTTTNLVHGQLSWTQ